ncbi:DUF2304 domain-containing protein [Parvibacter caecicola]|uniref:DUF2304 domain-containing protein n=1 Tax=Parvibacter caecicola TaxID=747645 RepID=UPI002731F01E|nr:DUF2304 domain-containing protein [Parvibacter caecicola]
MSIGLRVFLVCGALLAFLVVVRKIKKTDMQAGDSVFWLILCGALVVVAVFPQLAFAASDLFGFASPSNFVLLLVIAILMVKVFSLSSDVARLRQKMTTLIQEIALKEQG